MTCGFRQLRKKLCLALASACLLCCVTVAQTVRTSYAPGVNFSKYRTYRWVVIKGVHADPSVDAQIKQSIDSQLAARGLTKAGDTADLNVDYQTAVSKVETWEPYEDWSDSSLMGQRLPQYKMVTIEVGTLVIDMYDTAAKQLVWTGRAHKTLDLNSSREDRQRNLDKAAKKLLAGFPRK
jgi:hypothetical protein